MRRHFTQKYYSKHYIYPSAGVKEVFDKHIIGRRETREGEGGGMEKERERETIQTERQIVR